MLCVHCKKDFSFESLVTCEAEDCNNSFCEECWENVEVPLGAFDGYQEFCASCQMMR